MMREQAQYRKASDMLGEFLDECTEAAPDTRVEQRALFTSWQDWCKDNGVQPGSKKTFTERLNERGYGKQSSLQTDCIKCIGTCCTSLSWSRAGVVKRQACNGET